MSRSLKGALLSGLILPGIGQVYLGYKKRGWSIIAVNIVILYLIISEVIQKAYSVIDEMKNSGSVMDIEQISAKAADLSGFSDNVFLNVLLMFFIIGWFVAMIDAYRLGKK